MPTEEHRCRDCACILDRMNTISSKPKVTGTQCGKCYLKWKAIQRRAEGWE